MDKVVSFIKDNLGNLFPAEGGKYAIFPSHIPDGCLGDNALAYSVINKNIKYTQKSADIQLTIFSTSYSDVLEREEKLVELFNEKRYPHAGGMQSTQVRNSIMVGYDAESKKYISAVNVFVKW